MNKPRTRTTHAAVPPPRLRRRRRGATAGMVMIDAAIAAIVGALLILGSVSVLMAANATNEIAKQNVIAVTAARQVVDNLRQFKASRLPNTAADAPFVATISPTTGRPVAGTPDLLQFGPIPQLDAGADVSTLAAAPRAAALSRVLSDGRVECAISDRGRMKQAVITVQWRPAGSSRMRSRVLVSTFIEGGVSQ